VAGLHARSEDPAAAFMDRLDAEAVAAALERLPDEYRVACTLYFIQDMAYHEIAETLEVPVGTVRSRLHRGRRLLQRALWNVGEDRGLAGSLTEGSDR